MESNDGAIPGESNLFQEILLKINLPDHRSSDTDDLQTQLRNSEKSCIKEKCEACGSKVTNHMKATLQTRMIKKFTVADDLKESSKITQGHKGTKFKDHYIVYNDLKE
ncbi:hypothetical protein Tco_1399950 [Tanacetum coccineum]